MSNPYGARLFDHHAATLAESAISVEVANERGYVTADTKARLEPTGIAKAARTVPGLLIPIRDVTGAIRIYQYRPDHPRLNEAGKPIKYETTAGRGMVVDVPPRVRDQLGDPAVPLWVTEGAKKADSAVSAGLACVALLGVDCWRGSNGQGGKTALACWESIALNDGRDVFVCFDSDVMVKESVGLALARFGRFLRSKGASVHLVYLPDGDGGGKVGLDDYLAGGGTVESLTGLARPWADKPPPTEKPAPSPGPEPTPDVDGAALLDDVEAFIRRFCALPTEAAYVAVALWTAHTHLAARFDSTPRLALLSAEKQSGKTRTLEVLDLLCAGAEILNETSAAYMFRRIEAGQVTVLLDEADAIWKRGKSDDVAEALRSIVNSGHRKGGTVGRIEMVGQKGVLRRFRVYAPVALAGIGGLPDTILDRAVIIRMRRRAPDEPVEPFRQRTCRPAGEALAQRLAGWAAAEAGRIGDPWPAMPAGVADRPADVWEPLLAVAELAGGDWPKRAREACLAFVTGAHDDTASLGTRLLADVREVFGDQDRMPSADICTRLAAIEEAPWGDMCGKPIDQRRLARMLGGHGVKSCDVRIGERVARGYRREDLADVWSRYLPGGNATAATSTTPLASPVADVAPVALPAGRGAAVRPSPGWMNEDQAALFTKLTSNGAEETVPDGRADRAGDATLGSQCAVPDCTRDRRRGCRTCFEHMTEELRYA